MSTRPALLKRMRFHDKPISMYPPPREQGPECGCAMCRLRRIQDPHANHSLSEGVYDPEFRSAQAHDRSPRASLSRTDPNAYEEINRRNAEFWEKRGGMQ
jgi:hypothetical protein